MFLLLYLSPTAAAVGPLVAELEWKMTGPVIVDWPAPKRLKLVTVKLHVDLPGPVVDDLQVGLKLVEVVVAVDAPAGPGVVSER